MIDLTFIEGSWKPGILLDNDNRAVLYGDGCFETLKLNDGLPEYWIRHWKRLEATSQVLQIELPIDQLSMLNRIVEVTEEHSNLNRLRITLIRLKGGRYRPEQRQGAVWLRFEQGQEPSTEMRVAEGNTTLSSHWLGNYKTIGKLNQVIASIEARDKSVDELLLYNEKGELSEFISGNVFLSIQGVLLTPPLSSGCLDGVIRSTVIDLVEECEIRPLTRMDVASAEAVYHSNSIVGFIPVQIAGKSVNDPWSEKIQVLLSRELASSSQDLRESLP